MLATKTNVKKIHALPGPLIILSARTSLCLPIFKVSGQQLKLVFSFDRYRAPLSIQSLTLSTSCYQRQTCITTSINKVACSAGVFFRRANVLLAKAHVETRKEGRKWGESKGAGHLPLGLLFLLSLIFLRHNKDGGYNSTNINKQLSPAQNTPAQQAINKEAHLGIFMAEKNCELLKGFGSCHTRKLQQSTEPKSTSRHENQKYHPYTH